MESPWVLNLEVGQLAEMRTFDRGFRGAWFRCKIMDIRLKKNKKDEILLDYYDFELEAPGWVKIYQVPRYGRKSKRIKRQPMVMVRPQYPTIYHKSEMQPFNSMSQPCVVIDGGWKVGDLVDWKKDDCFWSAKIVRVLSDDKFQIELPMPPLGEGKEGEEGKYVAFAKDLRPFLDWSETEGWSLPKDGHTCDAHLIFPTNQGMDLEDEHAAETIGAAVAVSPVNASSTTHVSTEGVRDNEQNVKTHGDLMESSESSSNLHARKRKAADEEVGKRELNIMHEHTLEAAILDLEELINKVNWMQRILHLPASDAIASSWKFA